MSHVERAGLQVDAALVGFLEQQALPGTGIGPDVFWTGLSRLVEDFTPRNRDLLARRADLQDQINQWHLANPGSPDPSEYRQFLEEIGYITPEGPDFTVDTANVDPEIAELPGPQLVVPITNARYALNAANSRWGSLYDALYGTDAMGDSPLPEDNPTGPRGQRVVDWGVRFLDENFPLQGFSHRDVRGYAISDGAVLANAENTEVAFSFPSKVVGYTGDPASPSSLLLKNHGLHVELVLDKDHPIGSLSPSGVADIRLEAAVTTIMDLEDSIAAVDGEDKVLAYGNWLGLMTGELVETFEKGGQSVTRRLAGDKSFSSLSGEQFDLKGRSMMLLRNVGHLMTNPAILDHQGAEVYEGLMDALIGTMIAIHDLKRPSGNSVHGSIYVVKPKMHGPEEVVFTCAVFDRVEEILGLPKNTVKIGIMDEERRTTANLKECIRAARSRVCFINTGFLDRTGDEIHTSMEAGPVVRKSDMKAERWIAAYEDWNVDIGLACGLVGKAQIGKGMWAMPDLMAAMLEQKIGHPKAGANCAWVPSPTAAVLHAVHYHQVDVHACQSDLREKGVRATLDDILRIPLSAATNWSPDEVRSEIRNNAQGILGYVVRWVDSGVGCSKVPDINNVGLMEDRATCRISSQHLANWLKHGIVSDEQVMEAMKEMAKVVDQQNEGDPTYNPMAPAFDGPAFRAACDLVFKGAEQPSGYTEPMLHLWRQEKKKEAA